MRESRVLGSETARLKVQGVLNGPLNSLPKVIVKSRVWVEDLGDV